MKLLIITSVHQYKPQVQQILKNVDILQYSHHDVTGYRDAASVSDMSNWFVGDRFETHSIIFYAFTTSDKADALLKEVEQFNTKVESLSKVHVAKLNIENNQAI